MTLVLLLAFACLVLFNGDPDIHDALIRWVERLAAGE